MRTNMDRKDKTASFSARRVAVSLSVLIAAGLSLSTAHAADGPQLVPLKTAPISTTQGLSMNLGGSASSAISPILTPSGIPNLSLNIPQDDSFNTGTPALTGKGLLDRGLAGNDCLVGAQACLASQPQLDLGFSKSLSKQNPKGLDVELVPSASVRFDDGAQSALVGAVVRIGDDLRSKDVASNTWYVFAGADAEALAYSPDRVSRGVTSDFILQDRIIIGDAQAGIGYRIGDADVSLGYFRREISSLNSNPGTTGFSSKEDAAALSFTWKR